MQSDHRFVVDREALETHLTNLRTSRRKRYVQTFVAGLAGGLALVLWLVVPDGRTNELLDTSSRLFRFAVLTPIGMALLSTGLAAIATRRTEQLTVNQIAARYERDWSQLSGPRWILFVLRTGVLMGLGIGVPVGLLIMLVAPTEGVTVWVRLQVTALLGAGFIGLTLLWTIPFAFVLRWLTLRGHRRWAKIG